jgi:hypothetical protein
MGSKDQRHRDELTWAGGASPAHLVIVYRGDSQRIGLDDEQEHWRFSDRFVLFARFPQQKIAGLNGPKYVVSARGAPGAFEDEQRLPSPRGMAAEPAVTLDPNESEGALSSSPGEWRMSGPGAPGSIDVSGSNVGPFDHLHSLRIARPVACQFPGDIWHNRRGPAGRSVAVTRPQSLGPFGSETRVGVVGPW